MTKSWHERFALEKRVIVRTELRDLAEGSSISVQPM